jgi:cytochrome P450 family 110
MSTTVTEAPAQRTPRGVPTLPPGPRAPAAWQIWRWVHDCMPYLDRCRATYGDPFTLRWPGMGPVVFVGRPEGVKTVYGAPTDVLSTGPAYDYFKPVLGEHSLLVLDGAKHRRERRLMTPAFHGERMLNWAGTIERMVHESTAHWQPGQTVVVRPTMAAMALEIILEAAFGDGLTDRKDAVAIVTDYTSRVTGALFFFPLLQRDLGPIGPGRGFQRAKRATEQLLGDQIRKRRAEGTAGRSDVLSALIDARDDEGIGLTDAEAVDEVRTLIAAGHETGATALAWALHWVQSHPHVEQRLREELNSFTGSAADLAQLPYLSAVCDETLRICPPTPNASRMVEKPIEICGYEIPPGTRIAVCAYLSHSDPETFPEPARFDPDRFLEHQFARHEFHPFGGGSRRCIGASFAVFQMRIALGSLLRCFRFGGVAREIAARRHHVTLTPAGGRPLRVVERL